MSSTPFESPESGVYQRYGRYTITLKQLHVLQAGKVVGAFYVLLGILVSPFIVIGGLLSGDTATVGLALAAAVGGVVIYGVAGFLGGILMAFLYNLVAQLAGGLRFDFE